jgi:hypothetical protein
MGQELVSLYRSWRKWIHFPILLNKTENKKRYEKLIKMKKNTSKRTYFGKAGNTENDWVAEESFGSIDNNLVKLLPFGKVRTNHSEEYIEHNHSQCSPMTLC